MKCSKLVWPEGQTWHAHECGAPAVARCPLQVGTPEARRPYLCAEHVTWTRGRVHYASSLGFAACGRPLDGPKGVLHTAKAADVTCQRCKPKADAGS